MSSNNDFSQGCEKALACVFSLSGLVLSDKEKDLFREANPFGFIVFKRNIDNPAQLLALVDDLKNTVGRDCPVLIDQEGGRVARLRPPHWREYKPMQVFGDLYRDDPEQALEALRFETLRLAEELVEMGVNVDCAPVLDLMIDGAHDIIGDRSFSSDPDVVARLGVSVCRHFLKSGVTPIIKHIPGHGRARSDSHLELPVVDTPLEALRQSDFAPFRQVAASDVGAQIWAMSAHVVYNAVDADHPVSVSKKAVEEIIRGDIGFDGVLVSDDLDMKALDRYGSASDKANATLEAGCDLALYCAGAFEVMEELAGNLPKIDEKARKRLQKAAKQGKVAA